MRQVFVALLLMMPAMPLVAKDEPKTIAEAFARAAKLSQITLPGSSPFHLKATIAEIDSPDSDYKAEIEEDWVAPDKWRRTIRTPGFSQTIIVNGAQVLEQSTGDYYPFWLQDLVIAMFDLAPGNLKELNAKYFSAAALREQLAQRDPRMGGILSPASEDCSRLGEPAGIPPVHNTIFTAICFEAESMRLKRVTSPFYHAEFQDFRKFKDKQVARRIKVQLEPETVVEARITALDELRNPDDSRFAVATPTAAKDRILRLRTSEQAARASLLNSPEIAWAPVRDGKTTGTLSILVSVDKEGKVRETCPLNSDNPFPQDQARKEVMKWRFKPFQQDGVPAQMETILTFAYQTTKK